MEKRTLPKGWSLNRMADVCYVNPPRKNLSSKDPNFLTSFIPMSAIDNTTGSIIQKISRPFSEVSKGYTYFEDGDILFAKITPCMQNGKSAIAENLVDGFGFGSTEFHVLRPKPGVNKEWIYHFIRTQEYRKKAQDHFEGSAGQQRVSCAFIENSLIPFPPKPEDQLAIANELESKMAEVEKMRQAAIRQKEAADALYNSKLREIFPYKIGDKLPKNWNWKNLNKLGDILQGGTPSKDNLEYWGGDIPFITGADFKNLYISKARSFLTKKGLFSGKTQKCKKGDLLIVSRTRVGRIGIAACTLGISQDISVLRFTNGTDTKYITMYLKSISQNLMNSCQGATIKGLTREYLENICVPLPKMIDKQIAIAELLENKLEQIEGTRKTIDFQLEAIQALPGAILREVFDFQEANA
jgi:type I restriction enzyme S subunit